MTVMEAVMTLYTKEVATPDRVLAAVRRFSHNSTISEEPPDHESALVMWINEAVKALRQRICQEVGQVRIYFIHIYFIFVYSHLFPLLSLHRYERRMFSFAFYSNFIFKLESHN